MNKLNPEQLLVSPSVCRSCRLGKKRCDRRLPFCTRCARRGAECDYNTKTNLTKGQELLLLRNKFENLERAFQTAATHQAHGSPGSGVLVHYAPDINNSHISPDTHQDYPKSPSNQQLVSGVSYSIDTGNIHLLVYKQACSIFESRHTNFMAACDVYFNTVHNWQPILSKNHIYSKIRRISTDIPEGDLSILLLAICLIIQLPARPKICGSVEDSIPIYSIVKALHVQLQTLLPPSIYLLQAQLIITAFEHGHGLLTASYLSIGTCARLSEILAINRQGDDISHQWKIPSNKEPNPTNEERRLWWGCIIRDRKIYVEDFIKFRQLAIAHPTSADELPPETEGSEKPPISTPEIYCCETNSPRTEVSSHFQCVSVSNTVRHIGAYGREAQATLLLNRVIDYVNESGFHSTLQKEVKKAKFTGLDLELQSLLNLIIVQSIGSWNSYCGSLALTMSGLFMLHQAQVAEEHSGLLESPDTPIHSTTRSTLALKAVVRMTIQITYKFNSDIESFDVCAFPPCALYSMGQAGLWHIKFRPEDMDKDTTSEWRRDLDAIRECLWWQGQRWTIGLHHLEKIDKACDFPLRQFQADKLPHGSLSGIC